MSTEAPRATPLSELSRQIDEYEDGRRQSLRDTIMPIFLEQMIAAGILPPGTHIVDSNIGSLGEEGNQFKVPPGNRVNIRIEGGFVDFGIADRPDADAPRVVERKDGDS